MLRNTMNKEAFTITELAREFGVTTRTIRFYEDQGLLTPARDGRNRVYSKRDRVRLKLTLRGKRLGFSLGEVRELFDLYDSARDETAQLNQCLAILDKRRTQLQQQKEDIDALLGEIGLFEIQCRQILAQRARAARREAAEA